MDYTIGGAAKLTGRAKSTISNDVKSGKLSHTKNEDGSFSIDASELRRVYPDAFDETGSPNGPKNADAVQENALEHKELELEVKRLRELLATMKESTERERRQWADQVDDLRRTRDLDSEERRKLTAILTDQRKANVPALPDTIQLGDGRPDAPPVAKEGPTGGFLRRLLRAG